MRRSNHLYNIIQLSLPMAITQLITMGSGFLCMAMLAKLGHDVLAASALIFSISMAVLIVSVSLLFSLSILIGHRFGERDYLSIGSLLQQGWLLSLIMSIPTLLIYWYIHPILIFLGQDKNIAKIVEEFFHANIWRVIPFFFSVCNQQLCYGVHKQKIDLIANLLGVIVLLIFSYILIFGKFGFPELGVIGFGYSSALQGIFYFLFTTACLYFIPDFRKFNLFRIRIHSNWHVLKELFQIGWPISLQISGEMLSFLVATTFIGWLGTNSLAAYQVIMQYQFLIVIPIFAIAQASGILIGQAYGGKNFADIKKLGTASIIMVSMIGIVNGLIFLLFPKMLTSLYLNINDPGNTQTIHLIVLLFAIMAFSQFFDAIRNVLTGSLRGLLDTRFPMIIGLGSIWFISVPLGYFLGFPLHFDAVGVISGWMCGMVVGAIILYYRWHSVSLKYEQL